MEQFTITSSKTQWRRSVVK